MESRDPRHTDECSVRPFFSRPANLSYKCVQFSSEIEVGGVCLPLHLTATGERVAVDQTASWDTRFQIGRDIYKRHTRALLVQGRTRRTADLSVGPRTSTMDGSSDWGLWDLGLSMLAVCSAAAGKQQLHLVIILHQVGMKGKLPTHCLQDKHTPLIKKEQIRRTVGERGGGGLHTAG